MPAFPTLAKQPDAENFIESHVTDPTLRSTFENGYILTRKKFTNVPKTFTMVYRYLSNANKVTLATFEDTTVSFGTSTFTWTNPVDSVSYTVRFGDLIKFKLEAAESSQWRVDLSLVEVIP